MVPRRLLLPSRLDEVDTENDLIRSRQKTSCARLPACCLRVSCVSRPVSFSPLLADTRQPFCRSVRRFVLFKRQEKKDEKSFSDLVNTHCICSSSFSFSSSSSLAVRSTTPGPPSSSSSSPTLLTSSGSSLLPRSAESRRSARAEPSSVREYLSEDEDDPQ